MCFFSIAVSVCQRVLGYNGVNLMGEVWDNLVNYGISLWDHLGLCENGNKTWRGGWEIPELGVIILE